MQMALSSVFSSEDKENSEKLWCQGSVLSGLQYSFAFLFFFPLGDDHLHVLPVLLPFL